MTENFGNDANSNLAASITSGAGTLTVQSAASFPAPPFRILVQDTSISTPEYMMVTGVSGTTFTVTRGIENSTPASHVSGSIVIHTLTAGAMKAASPSGRNVSSGPVTMGTYDFIIFLALSPAAACVVNLPSNPIAFKDYNVRDVFDTASSVNPITLTAPAGMLIDGEPTYVMNRPGFSVDFAWDGTTNFYSK